ncbi:protealysin inhibitor emfourin [Raineyella fluvialis]|uniref:Metalloprotease n=1 Tax=Raineyella fluvialis TaxID=2662261 RepID=A0A5Q2FD21_9ACTN|nr:protealysin inhibitor emfourin [Raineyella fluvialis]QGF24688.1 hypothetical protein Rai3103_14770 [Raineyella fluvialis]
MTDDLHVSYRRTGGFAGLEMAAEAEGPELSGEVARIADGLLARDADTAGPGSGPPQGADRFTYVLEVTRREEHRTFSWSDAEIPEDVRPLLEELGKRSEPRRAG